MLPHLAELSVEESIHAIETALAMVRDHVASATVHVRAHHRRPRGAGLARLRSLPIEAGEQRGHLVLGHAKVYLALAAEDPYHLFENLGLSTQRLGYCVKVQTRLANKNSRVWRDSEGVLFGEGKVYRLLDALLPEGTSPESRFDAAFDALGRVLARLHRVADRIAARCERTRD